MDEQDILISIEVEIETYRCKNHETPTKIFMTYPLLMRVMDKVVQTNKETTLFGIPIELYRSEELEYYLAGERGNFRKWS